MLHRDTVFIRDTIIKAENETIDNSYSKITFPNPRDS